MKTRLNLLCFLTLGACASTVGGAFVEEEGDSYSVDEERPESPGTRGPLDTVNVSGSCEGSLCDGAAPGGSCFCDDECAYWGDCCPDKVEVCDLTPSYTFATYNAGLAHGAVALAAERLPKVIEALSEVDADVLCLQEVWTDDDYEAIRSGLAATYPHAARERTEDDSSLWFQCNPFRAWQLDRCVSNECTPDGISMTECVQTRCEHEYNHMPDDCKRCLAANTSSPWSCVTWGAKEFGFEGRNGLALLSREPLFDVKYQAFDSALIKRGVLTADVGNKRVQCTHLAANLEVVPYPEDLPVTGWREEHLLQVDALADLARGPQCTVLMGDLNVGPAEGTLSGEWEDNFWAIIDRGYRDFFNQPECTYCSENPLTGSATDLRIDHVLFKGCPDNAPMQYERMLDQTIEVTSDDRTHQTRLSDHYGLTASGLAR